MIDLPYLPTHVLQLIVRIGRKDGVLGELLDREHTSLNVSHCTRVPTSDGRHYSKRNTYSIYCTIH